MRATKKRIYFWLIPGSLFIHQKGFKQILEEHFLSFVVRFHALAESTQCTRN
jgi:hypothetical protein